jgi:hypothetical protein
MRLWSISFVMSAQACQKRGFNGLSKVAQQHCSDIDAEAHHASNKRGLKGVT